MTLGQRLKHELRAIGSAALYFGAWLAALVTIKHLVLAEYRIEFRGLSHAIVGALVLSKVVLVLEYVSLGAWIRTQPAWLEVVLRTLLYLAGVAAVMLFERAFEGRHEYGGFVPSLIAVFDQIEVHHFAANLICLFGALFGYNALSVIRRHLGEGGLLRMFAAPLPVPVHPPPDPA